MASCAKHLLYLFLSFNLCSLIDLQDLDDSESVSPRRIDQHLSNELIDVLTISKADGFVGEFVCPNGWYHNVFKTSSGAQFSPLLRLVAPETRSSESWPNVIYLSESLLKNNEALNSQSGKNVLFTQFSQFVLNEIVDANCPSCPPSYEQIPFPEQYLDHYGKHAPYNNTTPHSFMIVNKAEHDKTVPNSVNRHSNKINKRSSFIDGETIYGDTKLCSDLLRTFEHGKLVDFENVELSSVNKYECFSRFGSLPTNETPFQWAMHLIWIRFHNLLADLISINYPSVSDEFIYQESRKLTVAILQAIIYEEWLPQLLGAGALPPYRGFDKEANPGVDHLFDATIPLYFYTQTTSFVFKITSDCSKEFRYSLIRTCNSNSDSLGYLLKGGFDKIVSGMLKQSANRDDHLIVEDIVGYAKGPEDFTRQDLVAMLIQQSRYFHLPDYFSARHKINVEFRNKSKLYEDLWGTAISEDHFLMSKIRTIYGENNDNIDVFVGGLLESNANGPGPLFRYLIQEQFKRIRDGDRMFYENRDNGLFNQNQISKLKQFRFSDIVELVTNLNKDSIQPKAFLLPTVDRNKISKECLRPYRHMLEEYECSNYGLEKKRARCLTLSLPKTLGTLENCTEGTSMDNFSGSEFVFLTTFGLVGVYIIFLILLLKLLVHIKNRRKEKIRRSMSKLTKMSIDESATICEEWVGHEEGYRNVILVLDAKSKSIKIKLEYQKNIIRCIYFKGVTGKVSILSSSNHTQSHVMIKVPREYDLVLKFLSYYDREKFITKLEVFLEELAILNERTNQDLKFILKHAYTRAHRQKHLEKFFRIIFSYAFNKKTRENIDVRTAKEIIETELTQFEFAEALSMRPECQFVQQMFTLIDKDNNGYISFREFLDVIIIFAKGTAEQKIRLMFDMYDVNQTGRLSLSDFKGMIKSLLEIANQSISATEMDQLMVSMMAEIGLSQKKELAFEDFNKLFNNYKEELGYSELNFDFSIDSVKKLQSKNKRQSVINRANETIVRATYFEPTSPMLSGASTQRSTLLKIETKEQATETAWFASWARYCDARKQEVYFFVAYTLLIVFIFLDKFYYYLYLTESSGLRRVTSYGVAITRGSASVVMFSYSILLLTMCRNLITFMRETFLHHYIAFDEAVKFHKYIASTGFVMAVIHVIGHVFNFYHISTQRPEDLNCLVREMYFNANDHPKFHTWLFGTLTGLSGFGLLLLLFVIYIFAMQYSRRHIFNAFWSTHNLYPLFYVLIVMHGLGQLIQPPIFYLYFLLPVSLFTIDKLISASRKRIEISVIKATLHPSEVTHLQFKKPPNFDYKSGQWIRIACLELNDNEYHPFTIASAPHEDTLSLYIRAVGPFTKNIRQTYDPNNLNGRPFPKVYLDGPFGEGHQDWLKYDVSVLVGGGIGVTPFSSIIKDITFRSSINAKLRCKRVYFLWVTRSQKQFEWMTELIRTCEEEDKNNLLVTHIFITQFYDKFDLRTTMLYICERHFQRYNSRSLFSGLKAKTHFGRPNFEIFLDSLQQEHQAVERVGVFSCGSNALCESVNEACEALNRKDLGAIFIHHFENF